MNQPAAAPRYSDTQVLEWIVAHGYQGLETAWREYQPQEGQRLTGLDELRAVVQQAIDNPPAQPYAAPATAITAGMLAAGSAALTAAVARTGDDHEQAARDCYTAMTTQLLHELSALMPSPSTPAPARSTSVWEDIDAEYSGRPGAPMCM
ncbi:hypothetical protein [Pseudomonas aeruginosa]|uniref:hypothetical protein n=1 Tax=Pseudomonas aeruginosa TaxID=287 RepID=UPI00383B7E41